MVAEHRSDYPSVTAVAKAVADQLGIGKETVRRWVVQADIDAGDRPGTSSEESDMRAEGHAVESTCRVLTEHGCPVAARTYRAWRQANRPVGARTVSDAVVIDALLATRGTPEGSTVAGR